MSAELKPCPFCGGEASIGPTETQWFVECCHASCAVNPDAFHPIKHEAISAWNKRAAPPPPESGKLADAAAQAHDPQSFMAGAKWAQSSGELAKLREDAAMLDWLQGQIVDTLYMEDCWIIDVGGKHEGSLRKAIAAARAARAALPQDLAKEGGIARITGEGEA